MIHLERFAFVYLFNGLSTPYGLFNTEMCAIWKGLVSFICLMAYQILMSNLIPKCDLFKCDYNEYFSMFYSILFFFFFFELQFYSFIIICLSTVTFDFIPNELSVCQWSGRPGFNHRSSHTKDSKNGT